MSILSYLPQTQAYFAGTIAQSGSAWAFWAISPSPIHAFHQLSSAMACGDKSATNRQKLDCLMTKRLEEFDVAYLKTFGKNLSLAGKKRKPGQVYKGGGYGIAGCYNLWSPTIDEDLIPAGGIAELASRPSKKPYITGTCDQVTLLWCCIRK